jgi:hypothetical protein
MAKIKIGLACSLVLLSMLACYSDLFAPPVPSPTPQPVLSVDELQFKDPETGDRFHTLNRCIQDLVDDSWQTTSPRLLGNYYRLLWCRGSGTRDECQTADNRDQHSIELNTLFYQQTYPEVFGLVFHSLWVPESTGWGASYSFAESGESMFGGGWSVTFSKYVTPSGPPEAIVDLGWDYSYTIFGPERTTFKSSSDLPLREDLALYLSSPEEMRDRGLAQSQVLAQKVRTAINAHQVNTCDQGPYLGKGIPPACTIRPLTPEEEAVELARANAYFAAQELLLRTDYQGMYAAWMKAFPFDQCWPQ